MSTPIETKTCATCGIVHVTAPADARVGLASRDEFPGLYFECTCGSTMYVPESKILKTEAA